MAKKRDALVLPIIKADGSQRTLKDLRNAVKGYREELAGLEKGTDEYNKVLEKLAANQSEINNLNEDAKIATLNLTQQFQQATTAARGVVGGFTAIQSVLALLGQESDALAQTFVKLQAAMALLQSLTAITSGIKAATIAFRAFSAAILASPIGLIAGSIAALTTGVIALSVALSNVSKEAKIINDLAEIEERNILRLNKQRAYELELMRAKGASQIELLTTEKELLLIEAKRSLQLALDSQARINQLKQLKEEGLLLRRNRLELEALQAQQTKNYERYKELESQTIELDKQINLITVANEKKAADDAAKIAEKRAENAANERLKKQEQFNQQELAAQLKFNEQNNAIAAEGQKRITDAYQGQQRLNFVQQQIQLNQQLIASYQNQADKEGATWQERLKFQTEYRQLQSENFKLQQEQESLSQEIADNEAKRRKEEDEDIERRIELYGRLIKAQNPRELTAQEQLEEAQKEAETFWVLANNQEASLEVREKALDDYNKAIQNSLKIQGQIAKAEEDIQQSRVMVVQQAFSAISALLGEQTAAGKTAAIAAATIDTYQAANKALAAYPPPFSYTAAAATIATGIANVKKILAVKTPNASAKESAVDISDALPTFPSSAQAIVETHNNMNEQDEYFFNNGEWNKVYVTAQDINDVQNKVSVASTENTF